MPLAPSTAKLHAMLDRPEHNPSIRELIQRGSQSLLLIQCTDCLTVNAVTLPPQPLDEEENGCMDASAVNGDIDLNQHPQIDTAFGAQMEMQDDTGFPLDDDHVTQPG